LYFLNKPLIFLENMEWGSYSEYYDLKASKDISKRVQYNMPGDYFIFYFEI